MKHLHMLMAVITVGLFLYQAGLILVGKSAMSSKAFKGASHLIYLLLVGSGLYLTWALSQVAGVQHWAIAKIILLVMAVSATIKATRPSVSVSQAKAGLMISAVAYVGIVVLAITKPML